MSNWEDRLEWYTGDVTECLKALPSESVHCVVTSPPYYGLRNYGVGGQMGSEATLEEYVLGLVEVCREVRRVMRGDATFWLNLGDSYASGKGTCFNPGGGESSLGKDRKEKGVHPLNRGNKSTLSNQGLKPKDLMGVPWRVALALQADGWWLRQDIIWHKPNPMPESTRDRCTRSHEYLFMFSKGQWKSRVVALSNLNGEQFHFSNYFRSQTAKSSFSFTPSGIDHSPIVQLCVCLASSIYYTAQRQSQFSLPLFYSQEWEKKLDGVGSSLIGGLPIKQRAAVFASCEFLSSRGTSKEFLGKLYSLGITLADGNDFRIGGVSIELSNSITVHSDSNGTIAVNHSGKICKFDFVHGQIIVDSPSDCKYYYDADAIKNPPSEALLQQIREGYEGESQKEYGEVGAQDASGTKSRIIEGLRRKLMKSPDGWKSGRGAHGSFHVDGREKGKPAEGIEKQRGHGQPHQGFNESWNGMSKQEQMILGSNKRDVWTIATQSFRGAHFATFPERLVEPCVRAGTSEYGACGECGEPYRRVTSRVEQETRETKTTGPHSQHGSRGHERCDLPTAVEQAGWAKSCKCDCTGVVPCVVLDPFAGSGTTCLVALREGRAAIGIELNPKYTALAMTRISNGMDKVRVREEKMRKKLTQKK